MKFHIRSTANCQLFNCLLPTDTVTAYCSLFTAFSLELRSTWILKRELRRWSRDIFPPGEGAGYRPQSKQFHHQFHFLDTTQKPMVHPWVWLGELGVSDRSLKVLTTSLTRVFLLTFVFREDFLITLLGAFIVLLTFQEGRGSWPTPPAPLDPRMEARWINLHAEFSLCKS
jgi:hypothetical protein